MAPPTLTQQRHPFFADLQSVKPPENDELAMDHDPGNPGKTAPRVLNVGKYEVWKFILRRFLKWRFVQYSTMPWALWDRWTKKSIEVPDDPTFAKVFSYSMCSKFLDRNLTIKDQEAFGELLQLAGPKSPLYKVDFSFMEQATPDPGLYTAPTVAIFKQVGDDELQPIAIQVNAVVITPEDTNAWDLAKVTVMHNLSYATVVSYHPLLHFPMDSINVHTRKLPETHVVRQLLEPHLFMQLRINDAVRFANASVRRPKQDLVYTPFFGDTKSLTMAIYSGVQNRQETYKPYEFESGPPDFPFAYGKFLNAYYQTTYKFVAKVVKKVQPQDPLLKQWADGIAKWTPGFPTGDTLFEGDSLTAVLTKFIFDVALEHSIEHENYGQIPLKYLPMRMRVAPPKSKDIPATDLTKIRNGKDAFQHRLGWAMFFRPSNLSLLIRTKYPFQDQELKELGKGYIRSLKETDQKMQATFPGFPKLKTFARSIQY